MKLSVTETGQQVITDLDIPIKVIAAKDEELLMVMRNGTVQIIYGEYLYEFNNEQVMKSHL